MLKAFALTAVLAAAASSSALAQMPSVVEAGSIVNSWIQGGLRVTDQLTDLAIQGRGFFALKQPNGDFAFTRQGAFYLDQDGYLAHKQLPGRLLVVALAHPDSLEPIRLADALIRKGLTVKSLRIELDGHIQAIYAEGYVFTVGVVKLATFQNARRLARNPGEHLLLPTEASGKAHFGLPQIASFGSVYAASLEEVDSIYELSLD